MDVLTPNVLVDLREQVDRLREFSGELEEYYWDALTAAEDLEHRRYRTSLCLAQLTARAGVLEEIARHKEAGSVLVPVASLSEASVLIDAMDALDEAIRPDEPFDAVYGKTMRVLGALDRIALAAAGGDPHESDVDPS